MTDDERLAAARAYLAKRKPLEFGYTLPTPSQEDDGGGRDDHAQAMGPIAGRSAFVRSD